MAIVARAVLLGTICVSSCTSRDAITGEVASTGSNMDASGLTVQLPSGPPLDGAPETQATDGGNTLAMPCSDLAAETISIVSQEMSGPVPSSQGGTIEDGIYDLAAFYVYQSTGAPGPGDTESIRVSGNGTRLEYVSGEYKFSMVLAIAPASSVLNDTVLCPVGDPVFNMFIGPEYTATPDTITTGNGVQYLKVFQKRVGSE